MEGLAGGNKFYLKGSNVVFKICKSLIRPGKEYCS